MHESIDLEVFKKNNCKVCHFYLFIYFFPKTILPPIGRKGELYFNVLIASSNDMTMDENKLY